MLPPENPKIYHILHVDRLPSVIREGSLLCDTEMTGRITDNPNHGMGTSIGMEHIKERRRRKFLDAYPDLSVGGCVPFYFCPRSVMLFKIHRNVDSNDSELSYSGGQEPIVHLRADLRKTVQWANQKGLRWVFTLSSAGAASFEERTSLSQLSEINWETVNAHKWSGDGVSEQVKSGKQAEFLVEQSFSWNLVEGIGVYSQKTYDEVMQVLQSYRQKTYVKVVQEWYYPKRSKND